MKKYLSALIVFAMSTAGAQEMMKFEVALSVPGKQTTMFEMVTPPRSEANFSNLSSHYVLNEVNSNLGELQYKQINVLSGLTVKLSYDKAEDQAAPMQAVVEYELLEQGIPVSKGKHRIVIKPGQTVALPTANGSQLKVTAKA